MQSHPLYKHPPQRGEGCHQRQQGESGNAAGRRRLRQIAKQCVNYGQRVQNSVFECLLDTVQCRSLQNKLCKIMDPEKVSLRFYYLGKKYESKIEHFGCKQTYLPEDPMIL